MVSRISQRGLRQPKGWVFANLLFGKILDKNCMKMKEIGAKGVGGGGTSLVPALDQSMLWANILHFQWRIYMDISEGTLVWTNISFNFWQFLAIFRWRVYILKFWTPPPLSFIFRQFLANAGLDALLDVMQ